MDTRKRSLLEKLDALNAIKVSLGGEVLRKFQDARNIKANIKEVEVSDFLAYIKKWIASTNEHTLVFSSLTRLPELYSQFLNEVGRIRTFNTSMRSQVAAARADVEALMKEEDTLRREFWTSCGRFLPDYFHRLVPFIKQSPPLPICKYEDELWRLGDVGLDESKSVLSPITPSQRIEKRMTALQAEVDEKTKLLQEQQERIQALEAQLKQQTETAAVDEMSAARRLLSSISQQGFDNNKPYNMKIMDKLVAYAHELVSPSAVAADAAVADETVPPIPTIENDAILRSKLQAIIAKLNQISGTQSLYQAHEDIAVDLPELCDQVIVWLLISKNKLFSCPHF